MEAVLLLLLIVAIIGALILYSNISAKLRKIEAQNLNLNARLKVLEGGASAQTEAAPARTQETVTPEVERKPERVVAQAASAPAVSVKTQDTPKSKPVPAPKAPKPAAKPKQSLEDRIGGQWSVWVGGLALLLGAVLLIRYSIEAGFFGPGARIIMAYGLGALLLTAGEWLRRADAKLPDRIAEATKSLNAHIPIPTLLSAIGVFTWLGATYAAHQLYGFISAPVAFAGLGVISVGAMALSLRQGAWLALIGLLASFATPLLIQTDTPSLIGLYGYLLIIGAAALVLSHRTGWGWLALGVVTGWLGWSALSIRVDYSLLNQTIWLCFLGLGFAVTVWLSSRNPDKESWPKALPELRPTPLVALIWGALGAALSLNLLLEFEGETVGTGLSTWFPSLPDYVQIAAVLLALCATGTVFRRQAGHIFTAGIIGLFCVFAASTLSSHIILGLFAAFTILLMVRQSLQILDDVSGRALRQPLVWAVGAATLALIGALPIEPYYADGLSDGQTAIWYALYLLLFAAVSVWTFRQSRPALTMIYVITAAISYAIVSLFQFDGLHLSLALSLGGLIAGTIAILTRVPGARLAALGLIGLAVLQAIVLPLAGTDELSTRLIVNELWLYLALPALILGGLAFMLRRQSRNDWITDVMEAAAMGVAALFVVFQIRHLSNAGVIYTDDFGFGEMGLQVATGLCFTLAGLSRRFDGNQLLAGLAQAISLVTLGVFGLFGLLFLSPLFNGGEEVSGNLAFNTLTIGFLVPTILLALCAWLARGRRDERYVWLLGALGLGGLMSWLTAQVRFGFQGSRIAVDRVGFDNVELYVISAVWLVVGILLLAAGVRWREMALRLASAIVIVLTVLKTFLIDMAGLDGVLRPLSFVGLGVVLIVIGRAYQKYWLAGGLRQKPAEIGDIGEEE